MTEHFPDWLATGLWIAGIVVALIALHNLCLWLERRGWLYYKYKKGSGTASSNALMQMGSFMDPSAEHLLETRKEIKQERRAEDDPEISPPLRGGG